LARLWSCGCRRWFHLYRIGIHQSDLQVRHLAVHQLQVRPHSHAIGELGNEDFAAWLLVPGTINNFGGSSATEYKTLLGSLYQTGASKHPSSIIAFENYHQIIRNDPWN